MTSFALALSVLSRASTRFGKTFAMAVGLLTLASCAGQYGTPESMAAAVPMPTTPTTTATSTLMSPAPLQVTPPDPDPRVGLAAGLFDAAEASWKAADVCMQTHGGFGFAEEYDIERKFRETRLYRIAPVSTNLILSYLAEHVLGLPRSF